MNSQDIRRKFLQFFKKKNHTIVPSSPVAPLDDPTLLFINAGMNQFKDVFLGKSVRDYSSAASSQKCIRVGGKHNDLDNVGHTQRHLTFFEMLGNFSFGDYFKEEAIKLAWELSLESIGFEEDKLWATVFRDDDESFELWKKYLPEKRIVRFDEKDNFWAMGDTGPCGPCSELFYDRGKEFGDAEHIYDDKTGDRYIEYWNLVFMQFNRDESGEMRDLPKPCIDTGSGLERVVALKMGVTDLFQTDILRTLIAEVENISGKKYDNSDSIQAPAFHVIADHLRTLAFAIADGVQPSNVDRGYVLRKVLRRAVRYGRSLGMEEPFLGKIVPRLVKEMGEDFPELQSSKERICELLAIEEESFIKTLRRGGNMLNQIIEHAHKHGNKIGGDEAFKLKDTYGFPLEEILLLGKDAGLYVDIERYKELEKEARERSRSQKKTTAQIAEESLFADFVAQQGVSSFVGYDSTRDRGEVVALVVDGEFVNKLQEGEEGWVVLNKTPFYAEMGGQVGDKGFLENSDLLFDVENCLSPYPGVIAHLGSLKKGELSLKQEVIATVDKERRQGIANNHTATHILHWALQKVLGEHVRQAGSVVEEGRLRFDFSHHKSLSPEEIREIENLVNAKIRKNISVEWYEKKYSDVQNDKKIKQFFGEKYGQTVRVVDIDFSKELCGGTHTTATGNIGLFRIGKEGSIAAGVRRIEAVTGPEAEAFMRESEDEILLFSEMLKTHPTKLKNRLEKLLEENKRLLQELKKAKSSQMSGLVQTLSSQLEVVNGTPLLAIKVDVETGELRSFANQVMGEVKSGVVVLGNASEEKCNIIVQVSNDLTESKGIKAKEIIKSIAPLIKGGGGGKDDVAQAGGQAPAKLQEALEKTREYLEVL